MKRRWSLHGEIILLLILATALSITLIITYNGMKKEIQTLQNPEFKAEKIIDCADNCTIRTRLMKEN